MSTVEMVQGYEPRTTRTLVPRPMALLESGWAVSEVRDFTNGGKGLCFMRGDLLLYFYWVPSVAAEQPRLAIGTLMEFSSCCGFELGAQEQDLQQSYWVCTSCWAPSGLPRSDLRAAGIKSKGQPDKNNPSFHRSIALRTNNLLEAELWRLDLESHLAATIKGDSLFERAKHEKR